MREREMVGSDSVQEFEGYFWYLEEFSSGGQTGEKDRMCILISKAREVLAI